MPQNLIVTIGYMAFLFGLMYLLIIRPQKKKSKQVADMRNSLKTGDTIVTIGGLIGKVTNIKEEEFTIETTGSKVKMTFKKWALSAIEKPSTQTEKIETSSEAE